MAEWTLPIAHLVPPTFGSSGGGGITGGSGGWGVQVGTCQGVFVGLGVGLLVAGGTSVIVAVGVAVGGTSVGV
ncbi:MAG: hypothetical protein WC977_13755 [Anaerovoracaceae bacterium]